MKAFRIFVRNISSALKSITRNFSLSIASIVCTTITLIIVAIAIVLSANVNNFTKDLEGTLTIITYIEKDSTQEEITAVENKLKEIPAIRHDEMIYKTKTQLKEETIAAMCNREDTNNSSLCTIMNGWTEETNPLEPEFIVSVKDIKDLEETAKTIEKIEGVTNVQYSKDVVDTMIPIFDTVEKVSLVIILGLVVVTIFLICNTIRLTIFARRNEIEIMRLVGTSNFVIKLPFVIEGLFLGIIGSIVPVVVTIWGYILAFDKLGGHLFADFIKMMEPMPFSIYVSLILVGIGSLVGIVGSYMTVRKYLKI